MRQRPSTTPSAVVRSLPTAGGLTVLDLVARRLFSSALQPLVNSGDVPCQDREGALSALRSRPIETFDFHHPSAVTAHWAGEKLRIAEPRLALELSQKTNLPLREVSFWVDAMFRFAATAVDNPGRVRALAATVFDEPSAEFATYERLVALLGLMCTMMWVVLVRRTRRLSSDEAAALRLASFLGSLRQSVERADVIFSVNQDVWESAFLPRFSGGLADRLSEVTMELAPLYRKGILFILESRSPGMGEKILASMGSDGLPTHARGAVKEAAESWGLEPSSVVEHVPEEEPPAERGISQSGSDFVAELAAASAGVEDAPDAPTKFSPEAAIAAFNAIETSSEPAFQTAPNQPARLRYPLRCLRNLFPQRHQQILQSLPWCPRQRHPWIRLFRSIRRRIRRCRLSRWIPRPSNPGVWPMIRLPPTVAIVS